MNPRYVMVKAKSENFDECHGIPRGAESEQMGVKVSRHSEMSLT